jgi:glutamyl-tRNA reductase
MILRLALSYFSLFAAVQYIMKNVEDVGNKNILLFGKIGRLCENLVKHTKNEHITLINRTKDKAERAGKLNLIVTLNFI